MNKEQQFQLADCIKDAVNSVFVGKEDVVEKMLICLWGICFTGGRKQKSI